MIQDQTRTTIVHNATAAVARERDAAVAMSDRCARSAVEVAYARNGQEIAEANASFLKKARLIRQEAGPAGPNDAPCPCKYCCDAEGREPLVMVNVPPDGEVKS